MRDEPNPPPPTDDEVRRWLAVAEAATAGPFKFCDCGMCGLIWSLPLDEVAACVNSHVDDEPLPKWRENARLFALSREAVPALCRALLAAGSDLAAADALANSVHKFLDLDKPFEGTTLVEALRVYDEARQRSTSPAMDASCDQRGRATTPAAKRAIVERVYRAWCANPEQRLGQLLSNACVHTCGDVFYVEDASLATQVEDDATVAPKRIDEDAVRRAAPAPTSTTDGDDDRCGYCGAVGSACKCVIGGAP